MFFLVTLFVPSAIGSAPPASVRTAQSQLTRDTKNPHNWFYPERSRRGEVKRCARTKQFRPETRRTKTVSVHKDCPQAATLIPFFRPASGFRRLRFMFLLLPILCFLGYKSKDVPEKNYPVQKPAAQNGISAQWLPARRHTHTVWLSFLRLRFMFLLPYHISWVIRSAVSVRRQSHPPGCRALHINPSQPVMRLAAPYRSRRPPLSLSAGHAPCPLSGARRGSTFLFVRTLRRRPYRRRGRILFIISKVCPAYDAAQLPLSLHTIPTHSVIPVQLGRRMRARAHPFLVRRPLCSRLFSADQGH